LCKHELVIENSIKEITIHLSFVQKDTTNHYTSCLPYYAMKSDIEDSVFSSSKPREIPWFFVLMMLGIVGMVLAFRWFQ